MGGERPADEQDRQEILGAESEGMHHGDMAPADEAKSSEDTPAASVGEEETAAAQTAQPSPAPLADQPAAQAAPQDDGFLEETVLPPTVENNALQPGGVVTWGGREFAVTAALPGNWYAATQGEAGVLLKPGLDGGLLAGLGSHRLLPAVVYSGPEGVAVEAPAATLAGAAPAAGKLTLEQALAAALPVAQFLYFLERKNLTLVDLDPRSLLQTADGLELVPPPRLAKLGSSAPPVWREGYTPPEVLAEAAVSPKTGVYLLGALFFELLNGSPLPVEGASETLLGGLRHGGVPQVLARLLDSAAERATPQEAVALLKNLTAPPEPVLEVAATTNVGLNPTRPVNEDSYAWKFERVAAHGNGAMLLRVCVSDGMGGMEAGEVASGAAVATFVQGDPPFPLDDPQAQSDWAVRLIWEGNKAVLDAMKGADGGCTNTGVILLGARYALAHVGDTRAYLWNGALTQLTEDHSLVAALAKSGVITEEEIQHHPDRNKVLRSLGNLRQPQEGYVDSLAQTTGQVTAVLAPGEILLLVSDGVWGEVSDRQITEVLTATQEPQAICDTLVRLSLEAGAPDNTTALVVKRRL